MSMVFSVLTEENQYYHSRILRYFNQPQEKPSSHKQTFPVSLPNPKQFTKEDTTYESDGDSDLISTLNFLTSKTDCEREASVIHKLSSAQYLVLSD